MGGEVRGSEFQVSYASVSPGHARGGHLGAEDPRAKHAARGSGEAREQQRQLEGGEESEANSGGGGLQDGGNLDASPTPELKQGASTVRPLMQSHERQSPWAPTARTL